MQKTFVPLGTTGYVHPSSPERTDPFSTAMSQHPSLKSSKSVGAKRNVLKRFERIKALKAAGRFAEGRSPFGLPKTKPAE